jgi:hypothetical protein
LPQSASCPPLILRLPTTTPPRAAIPHRLLKTCPLWNTLTHSWNRWATQSRENLRCCWPAWTTCLRSCSSQSPIGSPSPEQVLSGDYDTLGRTSGSLKDNVGRSGANRTEDQAQDLPKRSIPKPCESPPVSRPSVNRDSQRGLAPQGSGFPNGESWPDQRNEL